MKSREEVITQNYLSCKDIQTLLKVSRREAEDIFRAAKMLQDVPFRPKRATITDVLKVAGTSMNQLIKQIELERVIN